MHAINAASCTVLYVSNRTVFGLELLISRCVWCRCKHFHSRWKWCAEERELETFVFSCVNGRWQKGDKNHVKRINLFKFHMHNITNNQNHQNRWEMDQCVSPRIQKMPGNMQMETGQVLHHLPHPWQASVLFCLQITFKQVKGELISSICVQYIWDVSPSWTVIFLSTRMW